MNKTRKNVWHKIFSPPCPRCLSTRTQPLTLGNPVIMRGDDFVKLIKNKAEGKPSKPVQSWKCLDCETTFDEKGGYITIEP